MNPQQCTELDATERRWLEEEVFRPATLEMFRTELAHPEPKIRAHALMLLAREGSIQDIALLSDLLNLPPQADEYDGERTQLLKGMESLARPKDEA